jgi:hypothetical protein
MAGDCGTGLEAGDFDRVWNGSVLRAMRTAISRGEVHPNCAPCVSRGRYYSSPTELNEIKSVLASHAPAAPVPLPKERIFGFVDTPEFRVRPGERIRVAGWMASRSHGAPLREVKVRLSGQELGVAREFHARPDVAAYYGRQDLAQCGWQIQLEVPPLRRGRHQLLVEGTDQEGSSGALPPLRVEILA